MFDEEPTVPSCASFDEMDDLEHVLRSISVDVNAGLSRAQLASENGRDLTDDLLREWLCRGRRLTNKIVRIP
jgi:hypothetical protein